MISEGAAWLIIGLPLASFVVNGVIVRPFFNGYPRLAGWITILAVAGSFGLSLWAFTSVRADGGMIGWAPHEWLSVSGLNINFGLLMDPLTAIMLIVVSGVSLMVQIYSQGYMKGDSGYVRYYAFMSLFTASMLGVVTARNIIQLYVFWELVGVCSYLLIGFWFTRPSAAAAAKKAFIVTRFGDFGFLLAVLGLFAQGNVYMDIPRLYGAIGVGAIGGTTLTLIALGIFLGAVGKSAQFPLHTWLPDAMEGPTPVSALIHSATMVAAGVFLVARMFPVFQAADYAMEVVLLIGAFTAIFAASMGLVANDIKRVLAYSTVSQLGYMMLALGVGGYVAAIFHLFTHAFFKALLFLGSGSVNHATGTFDMRYMGGLARVMPWTLTVMVVGGLSLAGIFPLAGFWSKDEILGHTLEAGTTVGYIGFALAVIAAFMTAFYIFRVIFMTFGGRFRGGGPAEAEAIERAGGTPPPSHGAPHLAESPAVMIVPMVVLGILAVIAGFGANPTVDIGVADKHELGHFLTTNESVFPADAPGATVEPSHDGELSTAAEEAGAAPVFNMGVAAGSTAVALLGILLAYLMYGSRKISPERMAGGARRYVYTLLYRKYYMDELYERLIVTRVFYGWVTGSADWVERNVIDNANVKIGLWAGRVGRGLGELQNGQTQVAGLAISVGVVAAVAAYLVWGG